MQQLSDDFLIELFKLSIRDRNVLHALKSHLKYSYLPDEAHKKIWKSIITHDTVSGNPPTIGILHEKIGNQEEVLEVLAKIKEVTIPKVDDVFEVIEEYIKRSMFVKAHSDLADMYNDGKSDQAFERLESLSEEINSFSMKQRYFSMVFADHRKRVTDRRVDIENKSDKSYVAAFGIHQLDDITRGVTCGDIALLLAQSGVGKSKFLKHVAISNARRGAKVFHYQLEGSLKECMDIYDASWSGSRLPDVERSTLDSQRLAKMKKAASSITSQGGEIYVEACERFDSATLIDLRQHVIDIEKVHGKLQVVIVDYFELLDPGDKKYRVSEERQRREAIANGLKNLALEFNVSIITATQASTVSPQYLNDPEFVQTRFDISEFKGAIKPFSVFVTANQTNDEYNNGFMRLYVDKLRKAKGGQTIPIYQRYDRERFYDSKRTLTELYDGAA